MFISKRFSLVMMMTLFCILLSACGPSPEEQSETVAAQTASAATNTPAATPTSTTVPTSTPTPTITNTPTPTHTPTIMPTFSPETLNILADSPINIGYLLWETNPLGIDSLRGIEIAISDFGGEIFGHPIKLTGLDSECHAFSGMRGSQILMQDETIIGIIGTTCSGSGLQAAPIVSDNNRVMISPSNSAPELTAFDSHSAGYFRTGPNDLVQIKAVTQYAFYELDARSLAVVSGGTSPFQQYYSAALCEVFTEVGGECVLDLAKYSGNTYVTPIINKLAAATPDAIYFMGFDSQEAAAFLSETRKNPELTDTPLFLWGEFYNNPDFLQQAGEDAIGVYITTTSYEIDQETDMYQSFLQTYNTEYSVGPIQIYHSYAYDAATLLLKAIAQVAVLGDDELLMVDPLAVRDALYGKVEFQGLSGYISCSQLGDCATTANGIVYQFISGDPNTFNPGPADSLSSNPAQVLP